MAGCKFNKAVPDVQQTAAGVPPCKASPIAKKPALRSSVTEYQVKSGCPASVCTIGAFRLPGHKTTFVTPCARSNATNCNMFFLSEYIALYIILFRSSSSAWSASSFPSPETHHPIRKRPAGRLRHTMSTNLLSHSYSVS